MCSKFQGNITIFNSGTVAYPQRAIAAAGGDLEQRAQMRRTHAAAPAIGAHAAAVRNFGRAAHVPRDVADQRGAIDADHDDGLALVQRDAGPA